MRRGWASETILIATLGSFFAVVGVQVKTAKVRTEEAQLLKDRIDPKVTTTTLNLISRLHKCIMELSSKILTLA